jgi:hypothetical protein
MKKKFYINWPTCDRGGKSYQSHVTDDGIKNELDFEMNLIHMFLQCLNSNIEVTVKCGNKVMLETSKYGYWQFATYSFC